MQGRPKITIDKFTGMGDNGSYFLSSMRAEKINGQTVLSPAWSTSFMFSEDTAGFSDISGAFNDMKPWQPLGVGFDEVLGISSDKLISFDSVFYSTASHNRGKIHTIDSSLNISNNPSVVITSTNGVLYTSADYLGIGYKLVATGASSTSVTVSGTNFQTLGMADGDNKTNKCYNLTKKEEYTITSIDDDGGTKNRINFSAAGTTPQAGDYIMVFVDNKFDFTSASVSFDGNIASTSWVRQGLYWNGDGNYYFLNGNYLAKLGSDLSSWSYNYKQLPIRANAECLSTNQDKLIIGASQNYKGIFLLTDGYTPGWLSINEMAAAASSITQYKGGFIAYVNGEFYVTDGYNVDLLTTLPDASLSNTTKIKFSSLSMYGDKLVVGTSTAAYDRKKTGIFIYDFISGWTFSPITYGTKMGEADVYSVITLQDSAGRISLIANCQTTSANILYPTVRLVEAAAITYYAQLYVKLPQKTNLSLIELGLGPKKNYQHQNTIGEVTVTVNYGDGKRPIRQLLQAGSGSDTVVFKNNNGSLTPGFIGQLLEARAGDIAGERSYVSGIAFGGTSNEELGVSPGFSASPYGEDYVYGYGLKKADSKSVSTTTVPNELVFPMDGFYSDKLFLDIHFVITSGSTRLEINSINVY